MRTLILFAALASSKSFANTAEETARKLFHAGVEAYKAGNFVPAAQAFLEAHELIEKPQLLFSAAQAYRREFDSAGTTDHLGLAVKYYQEYVDAVKVGGRRYEAARALGELRPLLRGGEGSTEPTFPTRLSVTSQVAGAEVALDGGAFVPLPYNREIAPGPHELDVKALGYFEQHRAFIAEPGATTPIDVTLVGRPPKIDIVGEDGGAVIVDGKVVGELPFPEPVELSAGRHQVVVTRAGHEPHVVEIDVDHGVEVRHVIDLEVTDQRKVAWATLATGGASALAAGVLGGVAIAAETQANDIDAARDLGPISRDQRLRHNAAIDRRDDYRTGAFVALGAGVASALAGLLLYVFDDPSVAPRRFRGDEPDENRDQPADIETIGIISSDRIEVGVSGRF